MSDDFEPIVEELKVLEEDGVPKNVKKLIDDIVKYLNDGSVERSTKINKALSVLDEITNDTNITSHSRTQFWNLSSLLESMLS